MWELGVKRKVLKPLSSKNINILSRFHSLLVDAPRFFHKELFYHLVISKNYQKNTVKACKSFKMDFQTVFLKDNLVNKKSEILILLNLSMLANKKLDKMYL